VILDTSYNILYNISYEHTQNQNQNINTLFDRFNKPVSTYCEPIFNVSLKITSLWVIPN
jgi:hypothetical protein